VVRRRRRAVDHRGAAAARRAQDDACAATGLTRALLPSACPFTSEQILDVAFWPA
jgi:hypothetical protein